MMTMRGFLTISMVLVLCLGVSLANGAQSNSLQPGQKEFSADAVKQVLAQGTTPSAAVARVCTAAPGAQGEDITPPTETGEGPRPPGQEICDTTAVVGERGEVAECEMKASECKVASSSARPSGKGYFLPDHHATLDAVQYLTSVVCSMKEANQIDVLAIEGVTIAKEGLLDDWPAHQKEAEETEFSRLAGSTPEYCAAYSTLITTAKGCNIPVIAIDRREDGWRAKLKRAAGGAGSTNELWAFTIRTWLKANGEDKTPLIFGGGLHFTALREEMRKTVGKCSGLPVKELERLVKP